MIQLQSCLFPSTDQCVDKAKVDESEQKAAEFSKKVRHRSHEQPSCSGQLYPQSFFSPLIFETSYWFSMTWSMSACEVTWSLSALQEADVFSPRQGGVLVCSFDSKLHFKWVDGAVLSGARTC